MLSNEFSVLFHSAFRHLCCSKPVKVSPLLTVFLYFLFFLFFFLFFLMATVTSFGFLSRVKAR